VKLLRLFVNVFTFILILNVCAGFVNIAEAKKVAVLGDPENYPSSGIVSGQVSGSVQQGSYDQGFDSSLAQQGTSSTGLLFHSVRKVETRTTHFQTTHAEMGSVYQQASSSAGLSMNLPAEPTSDVVPVRYAPPGVERYGKGADQEQLYYDAAWTDKLLETAMRDAFGPIAQNIETNYGTNLNVFETPMSMQVIVPTLTTMNDIQSISYCATGVAYDSQGNAFASILAGSGPTVVFNDGSVHDTQWVVIIDNTGTVKISWLFTRLGNVFFLVDPR
jgi:hypothetical protein